MSTFSTSFSQPHDCRSQRGVALVVGLVFLIILTLLGIGAMNTAALEEKMAFNSKDRNLAFQAAESALRVGENWIGTALGAPTSFPDTANGMYLPSTTGIPLSDSVAWTGSSNLVVYPNVPALSVSGGLIKIGTQPKYIIEYLGEIQPPGGSLTITNTTSSKLHYYRITARGTGGVNASATMVQSTYSRAP